MLKNRGHEVNLLMLRFGFGVQWSKLREHHTLRHSSVTDVMLHGTANYFV